MFGKLFGPKSNIGGPNTNRWTMFAPAVLTHIRKSFAFLIFKNSQFLNEKKHFLSYVNHKIICKFLPEILKTNKIKNLT